MSGPRRKFKSRTFYPVLISFVLAVALPAFSCVDADGHQHTFNALIGHHEDHSDHDHAHSDTSQHEVATAEDCHSDALAFLKADQSCEDQLALGDGVLNDSIKKFAIVDIAPIAYNERLYTEMVIPRAVSRALNPYHAVYLWTVVLLV